MSYAHCYPDQDVDDGNIDDGLRELLESGRKHGGLSKSKQGAKRQQAVRKQLEADIEDCTKVLTILRSTAAINARALKS